MNLNTSPLVAASTTLSSLIEDSLQQRSRSKLISDLQIAVTAATSIKTLIPRGNRSAKSTTIAIQNTLVGALDGLQSNEISRKEFISIASSVLDNIPVLLAQSGVVTEEVSPPVLQVNSKRMVINDFSHIEQQLTEALSKANAKPKASAQVDLNPTRKRAQSSKTFQQALQELAVELEKGKAVDTSPVRNENTSKQALASSLAKIQIDTKSLPLDTGKSGFTIIRQPVLPIFKPVDKSGGGRALGLNGKNISQPTPKHLLQEVGIKSIQLEDYLILENQILLAHNKLDQGNRSPIAEVRQILDILADTTNHKYELVSDKMTTNPRNPDIALFWIMPAKVLTYLIAKGLPTITKWGLPTSHS